jgi:hypothetical protein
MDEVADQGHHVGPSTDVVYQATVQHWAHSEQIRWTLLYNYLMATTILLLVWATVFISQTPSRTFILIALGVAGLIVTLSWIPLGLRASSFVEAYTDLGLELEGSRQARKTGAGPFAAADERRRTMGGAVKLARSRRIVWLVPSVFAVVYSILVAVSLAAVASARPSSAVLTAGSDTTSIQRRYEDLRTEFADLARAQISDLDFFQQDLVAFRRLYPTAYADLTDERLREALRRKLVALQLRLQALEKEQPRAER